MTQQEFDNFLKLVTASATMAAPIIGNFPDDLKMSPDAEQTSPETEAQTLAEFRVVRRCAYLLIGTMGNPAFWPEMPVMTSGSAASSDRQPEVVLAELQALLASPLAVPLITAIKAKIVG